MGAAMDSNLMFRTTGALTQSESKGPITVYGTPLKGMTVEVTVPDAYGANDTVLPRLYASTDGSTYNLIASFKDGATKTKGGKIFHLPFALPAGQKNYLKLELLVTVASTTISFGTATAGIVLGGGANPDRTVSWTL